jgi:hypothetical protein
LPIRFASPACFEIPDVYLPLFSKTRIHDRLASRVGLDFKHLKAAACGFVRLDGACEILQLFLRASFGVAPRPKVGDKIA